MLPDGWTVLWKIFESALGELLENKRRADSLLSPMCTSLKHTACQHSAAWPSGKKNPIGKSLREEEVDNRAFLRDGSKYRLGFGGLWQTA